MRTIYQGCRALPFALAGLSCLNTGTEHIATHLVVVVVVVVLFVPFLLRRPLQDFKKPKAPSFQIVSG